MAAYTVHHRVTAATSATAIASANSGRTALVITVTEEAANVSLDGVDASTSHGLTIPENGVVSFYGIDAVPAGSITAWSSGGTAIVSVVETSARVGVIV